MQGDLLLKLDLPWCMLRFVLTREGITLVIYLGPAADLAREGERLLKNGAVA